MIKKLEEMETIPYYYKNDSFNLLHKLCLGLDDDDRDLTYIYLTPNIFEKIILLLIDCYNEKDLLQWLSKNDYNPINNFCYAEIMEYCELDDDELEETKENALMYDDDDEIIVISW